MIYIFVVVLFFHCVKFFSCYLFFYRFYFCSFLILISGYMFYFHWIIVTASHGGSQSIGGVFLKKNHDKGVSIRDFHRPSVYVCSKGWVSMCKKMAIKMYRSVGWAPSMRSHDYCVCFLDSLPLSLSRSLSISFFFHSFLARTNRYSLIWNVQMQPTRCVCVCIVLSPIICFKFTFTKTNFPLLFFY